jgi:hypothetical protein
MGQSGKPDKPDTLINRLIASGFVLPMPFYSESGGLDAANIKSSKTQAMSSGDGPFLVQRHSRNSVARVPKPAKAKQLEMGLRVRLSQLVGHVEDRQIWGWLTGATGCC